MNSSGTILILVNQGHIVQVPLVDNSIPAEDREEVTKQSPSLSKLMFGNATATAPTFNSPDRVYNRGVVDNGGVSPLAANPTNGSVSSPSEGPGEFPFQCRFKGG
jgi:hypothetical protein